MEGIGGKADKGSAIGHARGDGRLMLVLLMSIYCRIRINVQGFIYA